MMKMIGRSFRQMKRKKNNAGFTLPELLISVGILAILAAIGMVAVASYQKSLKLTEMDDTARQIFVAAQNHLSAAKASGEWERYKKEYDYLSGSSDFWSQSIPEEPSDFVLADGEDWVRNSGSFATGIIKNDGGKGEVTHVIKSIVVIPTKKEMLKDTVYSVLLPEYAIDPTITDDGSYIIEYDIVTGTVYGVFYTDCEDNNIVAHVYYELNEKKEGVSGRSNLPEGKKIRKSHKPIIGYYGGAMAKELPSEILDDLDVKVINEERLILDIKDPNYGKKITEKSGKEGNLNTKIAVTFTGEESLATEVWSLDVQKGSLTAIGKEIGSTNVGAKWWKSWEAGVGKTEDKKDIAEYKLYLDDITQENGHFAELFPNFIPGENIKISVSCTSTNTLSVTKYGYAYTNSLFESVRNLPIDQDSTQSLNEATVTNIRHLQNLSPEISGLPIRKADIRSGAESPNTRYVAKVKQMESLDWTKELSEWKWSDKTIFAVDGKEVSTTGHFYGIVNSAISSYDGGAHELNNFPIACHTVSEAPELFGGLFSAVVGTQSLTIKNLTLENTSVRGEKGKNTTAGTLVGAVDDGAGLNIKKVKVTNPTVEATGTGTAGALVGSISGGKEEDSFISSCAVYLADDPEEKDKNALTADGKYKNGSYNSKENKLNGDQYQIVAEGGNAGGLVGEIKQSTSHKKISVEKSFASVPVMTKNGNAGGLVGVVESADTMITNSYAGGFTDKGTYANTFCNVAQTEGTEKTAAGGLVGLIKARTTVQNSYSTCSVYGFNAGGFIGVGKEASAYLNCYSTGKVSKNKKDGAKNGAFAESLKVPDDDKDKPKACYYMTGVNSGLAAVSAGSISGISGKNYSDLVNAKFEECKIGEDDLTPKNPNASGYKVQTHNYDKTWKGKPYPFATVNITALDTEEKDGTVINPETVTGVHYGDWTAASFQAELAYYEIYRQGENYTLGLYNREKKINSLIENTDDPENPYQIIQDGYVVLSADGGVPVIGEPKSEEEIQDDTQELPECKKISELMKDSTSTIGDQVVPQTFVEDTTPLKWKDETGKELSEDEKLTDMTVVSVGEDSYYLRFLPLTVVDAISPSDSYYSKLAVSLNGISLYFYYNPHYAKSEIQNCEAGKEEECTLEIPKQSHEVEEEKLEGDAEKTAVCIRTERQYSMMTQDLKIIDNWSNDDRKRYQIYQNLYYLQERSLDFDEENPPYTTSYFDTPITTAVENGVAALSPIPISGTKGGDFINGTPGMGFQGIYNGNENEIRNLKFVVEDGESAGMFGNTQGAFIKNLTLNSITVSAENSNYVGGLIGSAADSANVSSGSKNYYTEIQNVSVVNETITGSQGVGGLVGVAFNCTVNNARVTSDYAQNSIAGNTMVGGAFGLIEARNAQDTKIKYSYQNISVSGDTKVKESGNNSNNHLLAGTGGFAGEIYLKNRTAIEDSNFTFENINIGTDVNSNIGIAIEVAVNSTKVYGGLFVGNLNGQTASSINLKNTFKTCQVANTIMNVSGKTSSENNLFCFGGLIGTIDHQGNANHPQIEINETTTMTIGENCRIEYSDNSDLKGTCVVGGLVGNISRGTLKLSGNEWSLPEITGFTPQSALALGGYIGSVREYAKLNLPDKIEVAVPSASTAVNVGGLIGQVGKKNEILKGTIDNIYVSEIGGTTEMVADSATSNIGGVIGQVYKGWTIDGLQVAKISFSNNGGKAVSIGGCIGKIDSTDIKNSSVAGGVIAITGAAQNAGGIVGLVENATITASSVEELRVLPIGNVQNAGGFVGNVNGGAVNASVVENVSIEGTAQNKGGFIGLTDGGEVGASSVSNVTLDGNAMNTGGFVGHTDGKWITDSSVNGVILKGDATSAGGFAGYIGVGRISNSSVDNIELSSEAENAGGFIGQSSGAIVTNCDVRSSILEKSDCNVNEDGEYLINDEISRIGVKGIKSEALTGGFIGKAMSSDITRCFAAIPVKGENSYISLGGFAGAIEGGIIAENYASCNVVNYDYITAGNGNTAKYSRTGGFVGYIQGNNQIYDCYATGNVRRGAIIGGFVGELCESSLNYLNNTYSLGEVDQQVGYSGSNELVKHGGFMGWNLGAMRMEPLDLNRKQVGNFFQLLELDLANEDDMDVLGLSPEDKKRCEKCLAALKKRNKGDLGQNTSVAKYLRYKKPTYSIDSTAATTGNQEETGLEGKEPSVSAIVAELLKVSSFNNVEGTIKTWRLKVESGKIYFYYSAVDIESVYTYDEVAKAKNNGTPYTINGYKYEQRGDTYYQTKGVLTLSTQSLANYGKYVVLDEFAATGAAEAVEVPEKLVTEVFTGCTYLREDVRGYNASNTWEDSNDNYKENVQYKSFAEFKGEVGDYLDNLNKDTTTDEKQNRFIQSSNSTFSYSNVLEGENYPYPTLFEKVGKIEHGGTHWGDWPLEPDLISTGVGLIYYEKVDDGLYYHGYNATYGTNDAETSYEEVKTQSSIETLKDGLVTERGKHATEGGYLILLPIGTDISSINLKLGDEEIDSANGRILKKVENNNDIPKDSFLTSYDLYFLVMEVNDTVYKDGENTFQIGLKDEEDASKFLKSATFILTPHFADSVRPEKGNEIGNEYYVRTAKQLKDLSNSARLSNMAADAENTFIQTLDIDYEGNDATFQGQAAESYYEYDTPISVMKADFRSATITSSKDIKEGYTINGISVAMFGKIEVESEISGVTLTNLVCISDEAVGFVKTNKGVIKSCSIRPSDTDYKQVNVKRKGLATAGFVWKNEGEILDSSFIGTVELDWTYKESWGNISGFVDVNTGTIDSCYSNSILTFYRNNHGGTEGCTISGFCQSNRDNGKIINSHAISQIYFAGDGGLWSDNYGSGYGFAKSNNTSENDKPIGEIKNCYAATKTMEAKNKYEFTGFSEGVEGNYYLRLDGNTGASYGAEAKSYDEMRNLVEEMESATIETTHRYTKTLPEVYPFALPIAGDSSYLTMQHYGDWPDIDLGVGFVYYELIQNGDGSKDDKVYYHGWQGAYSDNNKGENNYKEIKTAGDDLVDGLVTGPKKYVREDGYLVILPADIDISRLQMSMKRDSGMASDFLEESTLTLEGIPSGCKVYYLKNVFKDTHNNFGDGPGTASFTQDKQSIYFTMTPFFGDSIVKGQHADEMKSFKIRSARQLSKLADIDNNRKYSETPEYLFTQDMDIDFVNVNFTERNSTVTYVYNKPIENMKADYSVDTWTDNNGNVCGYIINGINTAMFEQIMDTAVIKGITLTNVQNIDSGYPYGFADSNSGTIESCSIRALDNESETAYSDVLISSNNKQPVAGFVKTNHRTINNCYITGSIQLDDSVNFESNVAGFAYVNYGEIANSYANCNFSINNRNNNGTVTGFCYENQGSGEIRNSHSLGKIIFNNHNESGKSCGFIAKNGSKVINCYSAMDTPVSSENYVFDGEGYNYGNFSECYYLNNQPEGSIVSGADPKTYQEMEQIASDSSTKATAFTTKRYDQSLPEIYPFALPSSEAYLTMQHYGDWPKESDDVEITLGLVYYETIDDITYYHGYNQDYEEVSFNSAGSDIGTETGLMDAPDKFVSESGYLLLIKGGIQGQGNDRFITEKMTKVKGEKIIDYVDKLNASVSGCDAYKLRKEYEERFFSDSKADSITFNMDTKVITGSFKFIMTPYFADSVRPYKEGNGGEEKTYYIRSVEDLKHLDEFEGFAKNEGYTFIQQLDVNASSITSSIDAFYGTYYVNRYLNSEDNNTYGYSIYNIKSRLFSTIAQSAVVDGVTLAGCKIISKSNKTLAGFVGTNNGIIRNCVIRTPSLNSGFYEDVVVETEESNQELNVSGFVYENGSAGSIVNCSVTGEISSDSGNAAGFVILNKGEIKNCYSNCLVEAEENDKFASGFCDINTGTIVNSHSLLEVDAEEGSSYGFVRSNEVSDNINNCYAAMSGMKGHEVYPFAGNPVGSGCYYLKTYLAVEENVEVNKGIPMSYQELKQEAETVNAESITKKYGEENTDVEDWGYPFALLPTTQEDEEQITMQHYGDWPTAPSEEEVLSEPANLPDASDRPDSVPIPESVQPESDQIIPETPFSAGIAYYENDGQGYEGWYAITSSGGVSNEAAPYNTLRTDSGYYLADDAASYGILVTAGTTPQCTGAVIAEGSTAQVQIDGIDYDYYQFLLDDSTHGGTIVTVSSPYGTEPISFTYNPDFAGALALGKTLGVSTEEGGQPYQIRTKQQLEFLKANETLYGTSAYNQTLDIEATGNSLQSIIEASGRSGESLRVGENTPDGIGIVME